MQDTDGSNARFFMAQIPGKPDATVDLLLGAIGATLQIAAQEASNAAPDAEVRIFERLTAAAPAIVNTAMDFAFTTSAIGATRDADYETLLRNTEDALAGAAMRAGQRFKSPA